MRMYWLAQLLLGPAFRFPKLPLTVSDPGPRFYFQRGPAEQPGSAALLGQRRSSISATASGSVRIGDTVDAASCNLTLSSVTASHGAHFAH